MGGRTRREFGGYTAVWSAPPVHGMQVTHRQSIA